MPFNAADFCLPPFPCYAEGIDWGYCFAAYQNQLPPAPSDVFDMNLPFIFKSILL